MNYAEVKSKFEELFEYSLTDLSVGEIGETEIAQFFEAITQVDPRIDTSITLNMLNARMGIDDSSLGASYAIRFRTNFEESPEAFVQALDNFVTELGSGAVDPQAGFHQFLEERVVLGVAELSGGKEELNAEEKADVLADRISGIAQEAAVISKITQTPTLNNDEITAIVSEVGLTAPQIEAMSENINVASISSPDVAWQNLKNNFSIVANVSSPSMVRPEQPAMPTPSDTPVNVDTSTSVNTSSLTEAPEPSVLEQVGSVFVSSAEASTLPENHPALQPAEETQTRSANGAGIQEHIETENLSFGERFAAGEVPSSINTMKVNFDAAQYISASANSDSTLGTKEINYQSGQKLDHIVRDHYRLTDPNMIHRASLIIAAVNDVNANNIKDRTPVTLPPMAMLQEAAGSETLRVKNLTTHPTQIAEKLGNLMQAPAQEATQGGYVIGQSFG